MKLPSTTHVRSRASIRPPVSGPHTHGAATDGHLPSLRSVVARFARAVLPAQELHRTGGTSGPSGPATSVPRARDRSESQTLACSAASSPAEFSALRAQRSLDGLPA